MQHPKGRIELKDRAKDIIIRCVNLATQHSPSIQRKKNRKKARTDVVPLKIYIYRG